MVGTLLKSHKMRMSPEKQETLLKLSILSLAAILCKYISVIIHSLNVLVLFPAVHVSVHYTALFPSSCWIGTIQNLRHVVSDLIPKASEFVHQNLPQVL